MVDSEGNVTQFGLVFNDHTKITALVSRSVTLQHGSFIVNVFNNFRFLPTQSRYDLDKLFYVDELDRIQAVPITTGVDFNTGQESVGLLPRLKIADNPFEGEEFIAPVFDIIRMDLGDGEPIFTGQDLSQLRNLLVMSYPATELSE